MKGLKNIGLSLFLLLILVSLGFALPAESALPSKSVSNSSGESVQTPEIQNLNYPVFLEIEGATSSQTITEAHRFSTISILTNRIIPVNYHFRQIIFLPKPIDVNSPVPIFIKGHALLN